MRVKVTGNAEFANSYKMIASRVLQQKELGAELGISEKEMADAEKALKQYDISIRASGGSLRNLDDILKDTSVKFATMSDSDKQFIANKLAGVRQTSSFIAIMDSMNRQQAIYNKTQTDTNSLYDAQQKYANSLEGKLGSLKATYEGLLSQMANSDFIKGMVGGLASLIKSFGNLPTVIGLATAALIAFKGEAIVSGIASLLSYSGTILEVCKSFGLLKVAVAEADVLMATNPYGLIAVAITTAIVAFSTLHKSMQDTTNDIVDQSKKVEELNNSVTDLQSKSEKLNELSSKTNLNTNERQELVKLNNDLVNQYPELVSYYNSENKCFEVNAEALQKLIDKKREDAMMQNALNLTSAKDQINKYQKEVEDAERLLSSGKKSIVTHGIATQVDISDSDKQNAIKTIQDANDNISKLSTTVNQGTKYINDYIANFQKQGKSVDDAKKALEGLGYTEKNIDDAIVLNTSNTKKNSDSKIQNSKNTKVLSDATKELQSNNGKISTDTLDKLNQAYPNLGINAENAKDKVEELNKAVDSGDDNEVQKATKAYSDATQSIAQAEQYLQKLNKAQAITPTLAKQMSKAYGDDVATSLQSVSQAQDYLNKKIEEQKAIQEDTYLTMMGDDQNFYQQKIANNQDFQNAYTQFLNSFNEDGEQAYQVDFGNYKTLNELKQGTMGDFGVAVNQWLSQYVEVNSDGYAVDLSNFKSIAQAKIAVLKKLNDEIKKINENLAGAEALKDTIQSHNNNANITGITDPALQALDNETDKRIAENEAKWNAQKEKITGAIKEVDANFDGISAKMQGFSGGGATDFGSGGSGSKGKTGGSGKSAEKQAEEDAKKAQEELVKNEKQKIQDILDIYNDAKDKIENDIGEIDYKIKMLGDSDDGNFKDRIELTAEKLAKQGEEAGKSQTQLNSLKNTTVTTSEAQKELTSQILKASKELRDEKLAVADLEKELQKASKDEIKEYFENQKEIDTEILDAKQQAQNDRLDKIKQEQEDNHNSIMNNYEQELNALEDQYNQIEQTNELQEKKNDLLKKQQELENLESQKTVKTLRQNSDGTWSYKGESDLEAIKNKKSEVDDAQKSLNDEVRKEEYDQAKSLIEAQKDAEDKLYKQKETYLERYSKDLKAQQDRDKKRLETYYTDIDKLSSDMLKNLQATYGGNWKTVADSISTYVEKSKTELGNLKTLNANFTASDVVNAINSGDVSDYLENNADKMNQEAYLDEDGINNDLNSMKNSSDDTNKSVSSLVDNIKNLLSINTDNTKSSNGLLDQFNNLKNTNKNIGHELNTLYTNEETSQTDSQEKQLKNLRQFAQSYLLITNKFLELLQVCYDFRFNNIVTIVNQSVDNIIEGMQVIAEAYEVYAEAWNSMYPNETISSSIDTSQVSASQTKYNTDTTAYQTSKLSLYTSDTFEKYADQIKSGIEESLLNSLGNYSSATSTNSNNSSVVNNSDKSTSSTIYQFNGDLSFPNVTNNANDVFDSVIKQAKQYASLKSID
jgi:hypothetical protein